MAKQFHLTLSTPDSVLIDKEVDYLALPTGEGEIGILADHIPLVSLVSAGTIRIQEKEGEKILASGGGFVKVSPTGVKLFVQTAEFAESIDEQKAIEAKKEAQKIMQEKQDEISMADATSLLERNIARLKTIERKKRRSDKKI